ncbi:hypothetical protein [Nevskia sp.]|uniref:hypothetical protein n=1 Tax=Nevskia sp. TaxID=1929292 RepID=UPI0025CCC61C|nr:hypothetical protein [Nevskia sp.]
MNAIVRFRLHCARRAAAELATPESIRARHRLRGLRFGGDRGGIEARPPSVECNRDLTGHHIDPRTIYVGVIR